MTNRPPISQDLWDTIPPAAQAAVLALVGVLEQRIATLEEKANKNSTNSSKPPSSDPPSVKRRPPAPPSGKKRGGQPGHRRRVRALVPPEQLRQVIKCKPQECRSAVKTSKVMTPNRSVTKSPKYRPFAPSSMNTNSTV